MYILCLLVCLFVRGISCQNSMVIHIREPSLKTCPDIHQKHFFVALKQNECYVTDDWDHMYPFACFEDNFCLSSKECAKKYFHYCINNDASNFNTPINFYIVVPDQFIQNLPETYKSANNVTVTCKFEKDRVFYVKLNIVFNFGGNLQQTINNVFGSYNNTTPSTTERETETAYEFTEQITEDIDTVTEQNNTKIDTSLENKNETLEEVAAEVEVAEQNETVIYDVTDGLKTIYKGDDDLYLYIGIGLAGLALIVIAQAICIIIYKRKVANTRRILDTVLCSRENQSKDEKVRYSRGPELKKATNVKTNNVDDENLYSLEANQRGPERDPERENKSTRSIPQLEVHQNQARRSEDTRNTPHPSRMSLRPKLPLPHQAATSPWEGRSRPQISFSPTSPASLPQMTQTPPRLRPVVTSNLPRTFNVHRQTLTPVTEIPVSEPRTSFPPLPTPPESSRTDTSDEEWTYEELPPIECYLR